MSKRSSCNGPVLAHGQTATLFWIQSPRQHVEGKQWRTIATFAEEGNRRFNHVELPWGVVPALRLGQWFEDGAISSFRPPLGERFEFEVYPWTPMTTRKASEVMPFEVNRSSCWENGEEDCFVLDLPDHTVVLPVVECVRAFLTPCKFLAYGILEPEYLRRIVRQNKLEADQGRLELGFTREVARNSLVSSVVAHIARLLHDPSFGRAWDHVYASRLTEAGLFGVLGYWPLRCLLPDLAPTWTVRALPCEGNVLVVLEILHASAARSLPFTEVVFTHPRVAKRPRRDRPKVEQGEVTEAPAGGSGAVVLNASPAPPKRQRDPRLIKSTSLAVTHASSLTVRQVASAERIYEGEPRARELSAARTAMLVSGTVAISLSDQGGRGESPAAEFSPEPEEPIDCAPGDGLKEFSRVITCLRDDHPTLSVKWLLRPLVSRETAFTMVTGRPRMYAAVRLQWLKAEVDPVCWLLEVGRTDRFTLSTLVFQFSQNGDKKASEKAIERLLKLLLDVNGWWRQDRIPELGAEALLACRLLPHVNLRTETRARRLYQEAATMVGVSLSRRT